MNYVEFFNKLKSEDDRLDFNIVKKKKYFFRGDIPEFYQVVDPIAIEFEFNDGIVRLNSFDELEAVQGEYQFVKEGFIFASCNGEPIYYKNGKVWTCICGKDRVIEEELAASIENFFEKAN